ncbi:MAG: nucleotidyltransferase domain-containing protein [Candidatus Eremiobacteraeota bacterium]|nr:nucleotidyltransferase domain-containing protein [Candidatus Eremiobacteraeota bacterium]MCW5866260.1 nucleotidyltransferase domain-containing protein [Candidatus Eremiobacteraeota bacterium]
MEIPPILQERLPMDELLAYCRRHPVIEGLYVFGSVLNDWRPDSDVDLLVRFPAERFPDYSDICDMRDELAALIGREVDLIPTDWVDNPS